MVSILLPLGGRGQGTWEMVPQSPPPDPHGAEADFLMGSGSLEKQRHLSMESITFSGRQPSTDSFEERPFFLVGSFDLIILPE